MYIHVHAHMYILKCSHWCRQFVTVAEESLPPFPPHIPTAVPPYWTEWYQPTDVYNTYILYTYVYVHNKYNNTCTMYKMYITSCL